MMGQTGAMCIYVGKNFKNGIRVYLLRYEGFCHIGIGAVKIAGAKLSKGMEFK